MAWPPALLKSCLPAGGSWRLQGLDDLVLALVERGLAGFLDVERDQHFIGGGIADALDAGVVQPGAVQLGADLIVVRRDG